MNPVHSPYRFFASRRALWPLALLAAGEAAALLLTFGGDVAALRSAVTPLSAAVALAIWLTGTLPALLRPSPETTLTGALAAVFASVLVIPFAFEDLPDLFAGPAVTELPAYYSLRLINAAVVAPLLFHLSSRFPLAVALRRGALAGAYLAAGVLTAGLLFSPASPVRIALLVVFLAWFLALVAGTVVLIWRTSQRSEPQFQHAARQARLILFSITAANLPLLARLFGFFLGYDISYDFILAIQIILPLGITYTILRTDLFGIDAALRRTLGYAALSLLFLALYFGLTSLLAVLFTNVLSDFRGAAAVVTLLVAALAFEPLRRRAQGWIDRRFYPDRFSFQHEIAAAQETLSRVARQGDIIGLLSETLPEKLGARWGSVSLLPAPDVPAQPDPVWNGLLVVGGRRLGRYWLGPRRSGAAYDADESAQLSSLVAQAALALAYVEAYEELHSLNRQLEARVAERSAQLLDQQRALVTLEERQKLARDLHDSVSQNLFSVGLSARVLRGMVKNSPQAAAAGLAELEETIAQAQAEMRALLVQLRSEQVSRASMPPEGSLSETPLVDFIPLLAETCAGLSLPVEMDAPSSLPLPASQVNELLPALREALHNISKHSQAQSARCVVQTSPAGLTIIVSDNGRGFDPDNVPPERFGLRGIHERVAALGGSLVIQSRPGSGATLRIQMPG